MTAHELASTDCLYIVLNINVIEIRNCLVSRIKLGAPLGLLPDQDHGKILMMYDLLYQSWT
jgi:hypothetical protein